MNTGYGFTTEVRKKGPNDSFAVKATLRFLEEAGLNSDAIFQGDAEAALQDLMRAVAQARGGKTILRRAPVDHINRWVLSSASIAVFKGWQGRSRRRSMLCRGLCATQAGW